MKIVMGADHRGYKLKEELKKYLEKEHEIIDCGTNSTASCDYPDFGKKVAEIVAKGEAHKGILICGSGIGMSITANKVKGAYCALCWDEELAKRARQHNNANIIALPADFIDAEKAKKMVEIFLKTEFEGGRHERRFNKIKEIEKSSGGNYA